MFAILAFVTVSFAEQFLPGIISNDSFLSIFAQLTGAKHQICRKWV